MTRSADFTVFAVADDLSGAAETAMALGVRGTRSVVLISPMPDPADVVVTDLDTRGGSPAAAAAAVTAALDHVRPGDRVFKKVDSLLRGNVAAEADALVRRGYGVVMTPALPVAGRIVRDGVLLLDGVPLHETAAWRTEHAAPPRSVAALFPGAPVLGLDVVRSPALADTLAGAEIVVCDAETDADLDAIARAAGPGQVLAGSGGLAAALGRLRAEGPAPDRFSSSGVPLVVVGTAEPVAAQQVALLTGCTVHTLRPADLVAGPVPLPPVGGPAVVRVDHTDGVDPRRARDVAAGLAATVAMALAAAPAPVDLVLTGGETARRVLGALGVTRLEPLDQIHHGAVRSRVPGTDRTVVTRPGSFGGPDSLLRILRALRGSTDTERHLL